MQARCRALTSALSELRLDERFLWAAIRCATENRFRDELAYVLDAKCAADVFVAPEVLVGRRQHADIAELHHGRPAVVIELKFVWGADAIWRKGSQARAEAAYPDVTPVLRAVILYEGWRARDAAANSEWCSSRSSISTPRPMRPSGHSGASEPIVAGGTHPLLPTRPTRCSCRISAASGNRTARSSWLTTPSTRRLG